MCVLRAPYGGRKIDETSRVETSLCAHCERLMVDDAFSWFVCALCAPYVRLASKPKFGTFSWLNCQGVLVGGHII